MFIGNDKRLVKHKQIPESEILSVTPQNLNRLRDPRHTPSGDNLSWTLVCVLANINLRTESEVPSFTHSEHIMGAPKFKNGSRDPDHAHFGVIVNPWLTLHMAYP